MKNTLKLSLTLAIISNLNWAGDLDRPVVQTYDGDTRVPHQTETTTTPAESVVQLHGPPPNCAAAQSPRIQRVHTAEEILAVRKSVAPMTKKEMEASIRRHNPGIADDQVRRVLSALGFGRSE